MPTRYIYTRIQTRVLSALLDYYNHFGYFGFAMELQHVPEDSSAVDVTTISPAGASANATIFSDNQEPIQSNDSILFADFSSQDARVPPARWNYTRRAVRSSVATNRGRIRRLRPSSSVRETAAATAATATATGVVISDVQGSSTDTTASASAQYSAPFVQGYAPSTTTASTMEQGSVPLSHVEYRGEQPTTTRPLLHPYYRSQAQGYYYPHFVRQPGQYNTNANGYSYMPQRFASMAPMPPGSTAPPGYVRIGLFIPRTTYIALTGQNPPPEFISLATNHF